MKLIEFLTFEKISREQFAATIGVTTMAIGRYLTGERIPRRTAKAKIFIATQGLVQPNDFYDDAIAALKALPS